MSVFQSICGLSWAMTEDYLRLMLALAAREDLSELEAVATKAGVPLNYTRTVTHRDGVAIVPIEGPISRRMNLITRFSGGTSVEVLATDLRTALDDRTIRSILLQVDSPGGDSNGIGEMADLIYAARGWKPITAYVGHLAASGAYWLASAASEIVIDPRAALGSIGVVTAVPDPTKTSSKDVVFVSSQSPHKRPDPTTDVGRAKIQELVDAIAGLFIEAVARNRDTDAALVQEGFGQGGLIVGQAAINAGMADRIGSFEATLAELASGRSLRTQLAALYAGG
jgi:ClpP class serine protease